MSAKPESGWPEVQLNMLDNLWKAGKTASQIAIEVSRFGPERTKNAVLGMVHRRNLVARPSPITSNPNPKPKKPKAAPKKTLPDVAAEPPPRPKAQRQAGMHDGRSVAERRMDSITGHARRLAAPPAVIRAPMADVPYSRFRTCQWPIGDVKAEDFRFCAAGTVPGKPYCGEHCAKAYVPRERKAPAA